MSGLFKGTTKVFLAVFGLLLVGGAVAFAQRNVTLAQIFTSPSKAMALAAERRAVPGDGPLVKISLTGAIERNSKTISVENAGPVKPGEVVSFELNSVNEGSAPAREYRAIGQIPQGTAFIGGSALGDRDIQVSFSIDDGQKFYATPTIDEKQADGTIKKVAAPISMYTQVRFEWTDPLAAGGKLVASYQVRVK
jgi:hypothetical protein